MNQNQSASLEPLQTTGKLSRSRSQQVREKVSKIKPLDPRRMGLRKLYEPEEVEDIEVDILAIHGIGANPDHTWVHKDTQVNWLAGPTMLPSALPSARIMAYNYESSWFGDNAVKQSLRGVAVKLLGAINEARSECVDRPIILIGHCFGGLVALQKRLVTELSGTLHGYEKEHLDKDHFEINKFVANDDNNYIIVLRELKKMNDKAVELIQARRPGSLKQVETAESRVPPISKEKNFAPRDGILKFIEEQLSVKPCVALYGSPGTGKTHVTVEYAHTFSQNSQGRIYWVHAGNAAGFESSYKCIADTRGINREGMKVDEVLSAVYKSLSQDSNWLMVLDGCGDEVWRKMTRASGSKKALLDYVPKSGHARVLATTRSKAIAMQIVNDNPNFAKKIRELKDADAALLMLGNKTEDRSKMRKAASRAKELGGSAGTLVLAQLYQKKANVNFKEYMDHILKVQTEDKSPFMRPWRLLHDLMEENHSEVTHLLQQMASMDVQCIPNEILERDQLYKQVPQLQEYGMVEPSPDKKFVIIPPIIRECVQKHLAENGDRKLFEGQVLDLLISKLHSYEHRSAEIILPCALAAFKFQQTADHALKFAALHSEVAKLYTRIQQDELAIHHWEQAIHRYEETPDDNSSQIEDAKAALKEARERAQLNEADLKLAAKKGAVTSKVHRKKQALPDSEGSDGEGIKVDRLRWMHSESGQAQAPSLAYRRDVDWQKDQHQDDSIAVGGEHLNIALACERKGAYGEAEKHYVATLRIAELYYGPESAITLQIMGKLASIHQKQGQQKNAEQALQATLLAQEKALGADHPDTLKTRRDMAMLLADKGHIDAAEDELTYVLIAQLELLGLENRDTLQTGHALAMNYCWRGSPEKGESLLRETLGIQKRVLGEAHPDTTRTAVNLKELLEQMKM
ncbi:hypothetical protein F5X98DRAFT_372137 [Xylaria grammica]|nr:hypothetical protein F5X98DRAFT_372137 [Xylaria grammica]